MKDKKEKENSNKKKVTKKNINIKKDLNELKYQKKSTNQRNKSKEKIKKTEVKKDDTIKNNKLDNEKIIKNNKRIVVQEKENLNKKTNSNHNKKVKKKAYDLEIEPIRKIEKIKKVKLSHKKIIILVITIILLILLIFKGISLDQNYQEELSLKREEERLKKEYEELLLSIKNSYNNYVVVNKEANLYNDNQEIIGIISKDMYLELAEIEEDYKNEYFKLKNLDMYIHFKDIFKTEEVKLDNRYQNYIPFNKSVITNQATKIYTSDGTYYQFKEEYTLPIIIDEVDRYYIEFDNKLVYVFKDKVNIIDKINSNLETLKEIAILNYHFVINKSEISLCSPSVICHDESQFDSHISYIKENNFFTITMKELEMFLDSKINLPKKSVSITIDDGWFVERSIPILEKYDVMATLFLIGYLNSPDYYKSKNLEIHSHTWNLHDVSNCSGGRSQLLCYNKQTIIDDLLKSRESLNNTTYFCYPFYEYNNHTISALKEAGFTMALTGGNRKAKKGVDKYKVPRYVIYNTTTVNRLKQIIN